MDPKQNPVVCGAEIQVVTLQRGLRPASAQKGLDNIRRRHPGLQRERCGGTVVQLLPITVEARATHVNPVVNLGGKLRAFRD